MLILWNNPVCLIKGSLAGCSYQPGETQCARWSPPREPSMQRYSNIEWRWRDFRRIEFDQPLSADLPFTQKYLEFVLSIVPVSLLEYRFDPWKSVKWILKFLIQHRLNLKCSIAVNDDQVSLRVFRIQETFWKVKDSSSNCASWKRIYWIKNAQRPFFGTPMQTNMPRLLYVSKRLPWSKSAVLSFSRLCLTKSPPCLSNKSGSTHARSSSP